MAPVATKPKTTPFPPELEPRTFDGPPPKPKSRFKIGEIPEVDYRLMRQHRAGHVAWALHVSPTLQDRIEIYKTTPKRILFLAAALYPELVPTLNGEWEFLAILSADLD